MISLPSYIPIFEKDHLFKCMGIDATTRQQQTHTLQLQDKRGWGLSTYDQIGGVCQYHNPGSTHGDDRSCLRVKMGWGGALARTRARN